MIFLPNKRTKAERKLFVNDAWILLKESIFIYCYQEKPLKPTHPYQLSKFQPVS